MITIRLWRHCAFTRIPDCSIKSAVAWHRYAQVPPIHMIWSESDNAALADDAWNDYLYWQVQDKKTLKRVNALIRDAMRSPFAGLGKPEPLKWELAGCVAADRHRFRKPSGIHD